MMLNKIIILHVMEEFSSSFSRPMCLHQTCKKVYIIIVCVVDIILESYDNEFKLTLWEKLKVKDLGQ